MLEGNVRSWHHCVLKKYLINKQSRYLYSGIKRSCYMECLCGTDHVRRQKKIIHINTLHILSKSIDILERNPSTQ